MYTYANYFCMDIMRFLASSTYFKKTLFSYYSSHYFNLSELTSGSILLGIFLMCTLFLSSSSLSFIFSSSYLPPPIPFSLPSLPPPSPLLLTLALTLLLLLSLSQFLSSPLSNGFSFPVIPNPEMPSPPRFYWGPCILVPKQFFPVFL